MSSLPRAPLPLALLVLVLISGCASRDSAAVQIRTDTTEERLHYAEEILVQRCMGKAGFETWIAPLKPIPDDRTFLYGIDDPDWAERNGFGFNVRSLIDQYQRTDPNTRYFHNLSDSEKERALDAFNGAIGSEEYEVAVPSGGTVTRSKSSCVAIAEGELYGSALEYFRGTQIESDLRTTAINQALNDSSYIKGIAEWSSCMAAEGYSADDPESFKASYSPSDMSRSVGAAERTAAVAEVNCVRKTDLAKVGARLEMEHYALISYPWQSDLNSLARMRQAADSAAVQIIASVPN